LRIGVAPRAIDIGGRIVGIKTQGLLVGHPSPRKKKARDRSRA
jgi:hypothetical protein